MKTNQRAIVAYILFKSEKWQEKALQHFKYNKCEIYANRFRRLFKWLKENIFSKICKDCCKVEKEEEVPSNETRRFKGT